MSFDLTTLRIITTVLCFVFFVGVVVWTCMRKNKASFDEASRLVLHED